MVRQETYAEKASNVWAQQTERWMESANLIQNQMQKFADLWTGQAIEAQKESQKFMKEWIESLNKNQMEMWKAWQGSAKEAASYFGPEQSKEGRA